MKGFDFFMACYRQSVKLPVRFFFDGKMPQNYYRPHSVCFINLEAPETIESKILPLFGGQDVTLIADKITDEVREFAKMLITHNPKHLVVLAGDTFASWAPHRGWK